ncbi:kinase-like domain-containing protein [Mycena vitilis]|nr:kinase-like domain-containing protein [Mycena vitilis]
MLERPEHTRLRDEEQVWAKFQPWLEARGYMLRPRYRPDWSLPSGTSPLESETAIAAPNYANVLDAICMSDGAPVVLKVVETNSADIHISGFLTDEPGAAAFCVPIIDLLQFDDEWSFMIMPRMRGCETPEFETVSEVVEFVQQVLEGLAFLHSKNIAHRDICTRNIVMDYSRMIPNGFHFVIPHRASDGKHHLRRYVSSHPDPDSDSDTEDEHWITRTVDPSDPYVYYSRTDAGPMKYYYIDFGLSVRFPSHAERGLVVGECGRMRAQIPEISEDVPYDPFKVDIRLVGEMLRYEFLMEYDGLDFMIPFIRKLRRHKPDRRPDAAEALAFFQRRVVSTLDAKDLTRPISKVQTSAWTERRKRRIALFMKGLGLK